MPIDKAAYQEIGRLLGPGRVRLVAVSKKKQAEEILSLYHLGQREFGENYVQELLEKQFSLPDDIIWHFIGHLQSNKVKYIAPFIGVIQSVDSYNLLREINRQAEKCNRVIACLLQIHIAEEETKFGLNTAELEALLDHIKLSPLPHITLLGLMGISSNTEDLKKIIGEFRFLKKLYDRYQNHPACAVGLSVLSMGMSSDYETAIAEGSNMIRVGSLLFGARN